MLSNNKLSIDAKKKITKSETDALYQIASSAYESSKGEDDLIDLFEGGLKKTDAISNPSAEEVEMNARFPKDNQLPTSNKIDLFGDYSDPDVSQQMQSRKARKKVGTNDQLDILAKSLGY